MERAEGIRTLDPNLGKVVLQRQRKRTDAAASRQCGTLARVKAKGRRMQVALRDGTERVPVIAYPKSEKTP